MSVEVRLPEMTAPGAADVRRRPYDTVKRGFDLLLAGTVLILLSPLMAAIALLVLATSGRPILYRGRAAGRDGRTFEYFKFRTMLPGAGDAALREYLRQWVAGEAAAEEEHGQRLYKMASDPRVTPLGRILRRSSLDELPQLFNVVRGEMSLVGPRPPQMHEFTLYGPRERDRLAVRPGITGLAQVTARNRLTFQEMLHVDLEYVKRRSLGLDLQILLRTVGVVLTGRGAR